MPRPSGWGESDPCGAEQGTGFRPQGERPIAGGLPVHRDGRLVGAIGVGGGAPAQDHGFAASALGTLV